MHYRFIKIFSLVIVLVMIASIAAGCGQSGTTGTSASTTAASGAESTEATTQGPPATLKMILIDGGYGTADTQMMRDMQEKTNTKFDVTLVPSKDIDDKVNLLVGSGEQYDLINVQKSDTLQKLIQNDKLLPINKYLDKMPNVAKYWKDVLPASVNTDGNIYGLGTIQFTLQLLPAYRQDWLDKLGLAVPKTVDEFYEVAVAMATKDPDGNEKNDTYAFGGAQGFSKGDMFDFILGAYGVNFNRFTDVNGTLVRDNTSPGMKEGLKMLRKLYEAKAIDPEWLTDDYQRMTDKTAQGIYGATELSIWYFDETSSYAKSFAEKNPNGSWTFAPILTSTFTDKPKAMSDNAKSGWYRTCIIKDSKNLDAIFRLLDFLATDEGQILCTFYGREGKDWDWTDAEHTHIDMKIPDDQYAAIGNWAQTVLTRQLTYSNPKKFIDAYNTAKSTAYPDLAEGIYVAEDAIYGTQQDDYTKDQFTRMIIGDLDIDKNWDNYVNTFNGEHGGKVTLEKMQAQYTQLLEARAKAISK